MSWFKVDDSFPDHPKLEQLESEPERYMAALTVWLVMGADCARRSQDGRVTLPRLKKVLSCLGDWALEGAQALVDVGLWEHDGDDYRFHDWKDYQPTKAQLEDSRNRRNAKQQRWRQSRDKTCRPSTSRSTQSSRRRATGGFVDGTPGSTRVDPGPARPDPEKKERESALARAAPSAQPGSESAEGRGARLLAVFREVVLRVLRVEPSIAWRGSGEFCERVLATAAAQRTEPEVLLRDVLERWLARPLNDRERAAPLPCFAQVFGELAQGAQPVQLPGTAENIERIRAELANVITPKPSRWTA